MTSPAGIPSPTDPAVRAAIDHWVDAASDDVAGALAAVVQRVARGRGVDVALVVGGRAVVADRRVLAVEVDDAALGVAGPWLPGFVREALLGADTRRRGGVHHTSPAMAAAIVAMVDGIRPFDAATVVADPAVGGGVFLLAACECLPGPRAERIRQVQGGDLDPVAVAVTEAALRLWADGAALPSDAIRVADGLAEAPFPRTPTVVIGNPPFLAQLRDETARDGERRAALRRRWPEIGGYVDDAAAFLLAAVDQIDDGGVVALVQPSSFLSARDAEPVRALLADTAPPVAVWIDGDRQFDAAVDTIAVVVRKGAEEASVERFAGVPAVAWPAVPLPPAASWAALLLDGTTPRVRRTELRSSATLGDVADVTAGFRDQFYGLRGAVREDPDGAHPLITSGLVDPLDCRWGRTSCRFDRQTWQHPCVDPAVVAPGIRRWVADRLRPKLLVASQTRTIEVIIDSAGVMVPCTPVVSVEPRPGAPSLAHLAAALSSPVASALLLAEVAGSALSRDAMRVSATAIASLPLPAEGPDWDAAAAMAEAVTDPAPMERIGASMLAAYGVGDRTDVLNWWRARLPCR